MTFPPGSLPLALGADGAWESADGAGVLSAAELLKERAKTEVCFKAAFILDLIMAVCAIQSILRALEASL